MTVWWQAKRLAEEEAQRQAEEEMAAALRKKNADLESRYGVMVKELDHEFGVAPGSIKSGKSTPAATPTTTPASTPGKARGF